MPKKIVRLWWKFQSTPHFWANCASTAACMLQWTKKHVIIDCDNGILTMAYKILRLFRDARKLILQPLVVKYLIWKWFTSIVHLPGKAEVYHFKNQGSRLRHSMEGKDTFSRIIRTLDNDIEDGVTQMARQLLQEWGHQRNTGSSEMDLAAYTVCALFIASTIHR